jgi:hypothetical protein
VLSREVSLAAATTLCSGSSDIPATHPSSTYNLQARTHVRVTDPALIGDRASK